MKALTKKTKILLIAAAVAVVLLVLVVILFAPALIQPLLWTLLVLGLGFFAVELWSRRRRKSKQKNFDERVAAKEGIEDRRREWTGWIEELERQGIDRYELPFYLLVGEPQSGKSVLLQNSDLYFPFGQERLSGVGGTRGCDWWFTDEAVILDIAGRLFTHEGGVADRLEYEAFLEMLTDFRPMCPANGVLLVVPCDALLADSPEVCADKANKIQSALLTLTQKLQAQLPVYLVLTKGDRVFGFAESVHRLDAEERHQMFGWSREAERAERPFELEEAKTGFTELVDRVRLLRERMIATARLPEALPEIDRMYAFPDELNGMYRSLEIYLKRIFTQSSLVDRTSFRGIYLTSGLQSGAPVARVCAELLGENRESDARTLESLFSHQRAYFIKDLVRKRVFAERGLVRPTEGRVQKARRTAMFGFGASGVLAAAAVIGCVVHLGTSGAGPAEIPIRAAVQAGKDSVGQTSVPLLLGALDTVRKAVDADRELMEDVFKSSRESCQKLYDGMCDLALLPAIRQRLEQLVLERAGAEPASYDEFRATLTAARSLYGDMVFTDRATVELGRKWLGGEWTMQVVDARGAQGDFSVADALQLRRAGGEARSPVGDRSRLEPLARRLLTLLDRAFDPATPWLPQGHLGYMIARFGVEESASRVDSARDAKDYLDICDVYANGLDAIEAMTDKIKDRIVTNRDYLAELSDMVEVWQVLRQFTNQDADEKNWAALQRVEAFADKFWNDYRTNEGLAITTLNGPAGRLLSKLQQKTTGKMLAKVPVDAGRLGMLLKDVAVRDACRAEPRGAWTLRSVVPAVGLNVTRLNDVYKAKVRLMAAQLPTRFPDWAAASAEFHRGKEPPAPGQLDQALLGTLARLRGDLEPYRLPDRQAQSHLARLMVEHLRAVEAAWAARKEPATAIDWSVPTTLARLVAQEGLEPEVKALADTLRWRYLAPHEERLQREWLALPDGTEATLSYVTAANEHLTRLAEVDKAFENRETPREDVDHKAWLQRLDGELSGRLQKHVEEQLAYWRPDTKWANLEQAVDAVQKALEAKTIRDKALAASRSVKAPAADAPELRAGQPIADGPQLPATGKALALLRGFVVPDVGDVQSHEIARQLTDLCSKLRGVLQENDVQLASMAVALAPLGVAPPVMRTTDHYLRPLYDGLRDRLVAEVRGRYLRAVDRAVQLGGPELMNALYATSREQINAVVDQDVVRRLAALLTVDGRFDVARRDYRMLPDAKDPAKPHLRPGKELAGSAVEREWWRFEQFLVDLQAFLAKGDPKIQGTVFRVLFELPRRSPGMVWDIATTQRQFCYHAAHSAGRIEPGLVAFNKEWERFAKPLEWEFQDTRRPVLWFLWTNRVRIESFQWPRDRADGDIAYDLNGCLAPLLLAWSGTEDAGWWIVTMQPDNTTEKAMLRLSFAGGDGVAVPLPVRPPRPAPF